MSINTVIVAQSFGMGANGTPGLSNEAMAKIVLKIRERTGLSMILQIEVANALLKLLPEKPKDLWIIKEHREKGKYLDTREVVYQTWGIMEKHNWTEAVVVAHPAHVSRVTRLFKKMGMETLIPKKDIESIPFDPNSTQWWTRNIFLWGLREIPSRIIYKMRGWT